MRAQSSNLNEELGQVEYVFSDKTGTLTCNIMQFKKFTAGPKSYGTDEAPLTEQEENVCFHDPALMEDMKDESPNAENIRKTLLFLSLCHTIIIDQKTGKYNASSPDELALVNAAKQFGFEFLNRDEDDNLRIRDDKGEEKEYKLLSVCEFSSTRKRMSVILREPDGKILLMCKGADTVITERLTNESKNSEVFENT